MKYMLIADTTEIWCNYLELLVEYDVRIDEIGLMYEEIGTETEPELQELPGWHVNIWFVGISETVTPPVYPGIVEVQPDTPSRIWA